uniref:Serine protease n=1 Tax=Zootermopsis nevadensis sobeli-like virus 4 TaxID=3133525 RepID=A0AAT9JG37_9VIRU
MFAKIVKMYELEVLTWLLAVVDFVYDNAAPIARLLIFLVCYTAVVSACYSIWRFVYYWSLPFRVVWKLVKPVVPKPHVYVAEAMMPESPLIPLLPGPYTVKIMQEGSKKIVCHGFRINDYIVVPHHGIMFEKLYYEDRDGNAWDIPPEEFIYELMTDVACFKLAPDRLMKTAKVGVCCSGLATVAGFGPVSGSIGMVTDLGFELYSYSGSTVAGMSGCPLVQNGKVIGMHLGTTGSVNVGVKTAYIQHLLTRLQTPQPESSDYALLLKLSEADKKELRFRDIGDPDEYEATYQGRYFRLSKSEMRRLQRQEEQEEAEWEEAAFGDRGDSRELTRELKELQLELEADLAAIAEEEKQEINPPAPENHVDPLPEYTFPENCLPPRAGPNCPGAYPITQGSTSPSQPRCLACQHRIPPALSGLQVPQTLCETPLKPTTASAKTRRNLRNRQTRAKRLSSRLGSLISILSEFVPPQTLMSHTERAPKRSTKPSRPSTSRPEQDLDYSRLRQALAKLSGGMERRAPTQATSTSSEPSSSTNSKDSQKTPPVTPTT